MAAMRLLQLVDSCVGILCCKPRRRWYSPDARRSGVVGEVCFCLALLFPSVAQAEASVGVWEKRVSELEATIQRSRTQMVEREEVHLQASHRAHIPTAHLCLT